MKFLTCPKEEAETAIVYHTRNGSLLIIPNNKSPGKKPEVLYIFKKDIDILAS
jgi:hypothetical protein